MIDLLPNVASEWTLPEHRDRSDAPRFMLRTLPARTILELQGVENSGRAIWLVALATVVGIENVTVGGEPLKVDPQPERRIDGVTIPAGSVSEAVLDQLPAGWIAQIGNEASIRHTVTPDDLGKSG